MAQKGEKVVLVRLETSPEDIEGMKAAQGILTVRGGMTLTPLLLHVVWVPAVYPVVPKSTWMKKTRNLSWLARLMSKAITFLSMVLPVTFMTVSSLPLMLLSAANSVGVMEWADKYRKLRVRTNADTRLMLRKPEASAQKVLVCAVPSICSLKKTEFRLSVK